ncbi:AzlC family ABC transporter permease [Corynebacterium mendelii]|uniref:AzlC family ABC transporter permease n=1 Tax=Corynebacterium mendelii TaxID=2765362 RepID=A0A939IXQ2_9CORY|nr:AzlC family ABC transporter permease [Corynebacterium mendelii]MBN9644288.1 AzlC family ABC transporter permease [Corynebacterium mendelii]
MTDQVPEQRAACSSTVQQIRLGLKDSLAVMLGLLPIGLAFGFFVTQSGFAWWWAPVFSIVIYAGSAEFIAVGVVTGGTGVLAAAVTAFMVNFRHLFYGLTFPLDNIRGRPAKLWSVYSLTDEVYAIVCSARNKTWTHTRIITVSVACWLSWWIPGIAGAVAGLALPDNLEGAEFALTALMIVLAMEAFRGNPDYSLPLSAAALAVGAGFLLPGGMLVAALSCYFIVLWVRYRCPRVDASMTLRRPTDAPDFGDKEQP